jgi:MFS family permease
MIELIDQPTEQTTAATNLVLCVIALAAITILHRLRHRDPWKATIWIAAFTAGLVANLLAASAHGLKLSDGMYNLAWALIYLSLALMIACFVIGTIHDLWGRRASRKAAPVLATIAMLFFAVTRLESAFVVFILYQATAMGLALLGYGYLTLMRHQPGAGLVWAGLLISILATAVQAVPIVDQITVVWTFDHNGHYHLVQAVGVILLILGLRGALLATQQSAARTTPQLGAAFDGCARCWWWHD